jgi:quinol monooxygenase YgiN
MDVRIVRLDATTGHDSMTGRPQISHPGRARCPPLTSTVPFVAPGRIIVLRLSRFDFDTPDGEVFRTAMIHVIATIELHGGGRDAYLAEFHKLVPQVLAEDGCLEYGPTLDLATDIPAQQAARPDVVTVVEKWASVEHLKRHLIAPHMQEYRPKVKNLVVRSSLVILTPA